MRIFFLLLALCASGLAAELRLDSAGVDSAKPTTLSLHLNAPDAELTGVQFDVEYDAAKFDVKLEIGPAAEGAAKVLQSNVLRPGKVRVLIFGFNRNKIGDGIVALAHISVKDGVQVNESHPILISDTVGTSAEGVAVKVTGVGGNLTKGTRGEVR